MSVNRGFLALCLLFLFQTTYIVHGAIITVFPHEDEVCIESLNHLWYPKMSNILIGIPSLAVFGRILWARESVEKISFFYSFIFRFSYIPLSSYSLMFTKHSLPACIHPPIAKCIFSPFFPFVYIYSVIMNK